MHYAFDLWMQRNYPQCQFCRYADDAVVHCGSQEQAREVMQSIASRLSECGLTMHPEKSKIVYCKDSNRTQAYPHVYFTFLGFTFRPRKAIGNSRRIFTSFLPGVSADAMKKMRAAVRGWRLNRQTHVALAALAKLYNRSSAGGGTTTGRSIRQQCSIFTCTSTVRSNDGPDVSTKPYRNDCAPECSGCAR